MPSVLFVCTGNQYRSPIAAAAFLRLLNQRGLADQWTVKSAGTRTIPGQPPLPNAVRVAQELGLNISNHTTRMITADDLSKYDLVLVMEWRQKQALCYEFPAASKRIHLLSEVVNHLDYDIWDPVDPSVSARGVAIELCDSIRRGFWDICGLAESNGLDDPEQAVNVTEAQIQSLNYALSLPTVSP